jgi:hypothetical protein
MERPALQTGTKGGPTPAFSRWLKEITLIDQKGCFTHQDAENRADSASRLERNVGWRIGYGPLNMRFSCGRTGIVSWHLFLRGRPDR